MTSKREAAIAAKQKIKEDRLAAKQLVADQKAAAEQKETAAMQKMMLKFKSRVDAICVKHGLDFQIEKEQLMGVETKRVTEYFGLYNSKTNDAINTCKDGYTVSQNDEIISLILQGAEPFGDKINVTKAGSLHGGRKVFMQLEVAGMSKVGNDHIKRYVTIIDSNDGSTGFSVGIGDLTMSCSNQFFKFYKSGIAKFRHTATLEQKLRTVPSLIEGALAESLRQVTIYKKFVSTPVSKDLAHELVHALLGHDKMFTPAAILAAKPTKAITHMESLYSMINAEMNSKGQNLWGLHSGITRFTTHVKSSPNRHNGLAETLMTGSSYTMAMNSFNFCANKAGILVNTNQLTEVE